MGSSQVSVVQCSAGLYTPVPEFGSVSSTGSLVFSQARVVLVPPEQDLTVLLLAEFFGAMAGVVAVALACPGQSSLVRCRGWSKRLIRSG